MPHVPIALSSASVYPLNVHDAFAVAHDLGYDGVEVMVTNNQDSQNTQVLRSLSQKYAQPILAVHAPTLLLTQQVWGKAWNKIHRSAQMAHDVGAEVVVAHPPFRWQTGYAESFAEGIRDIENEYGVRIAVENMYPWRVRGSDMKAYLPHWDPVELDYQNVTWDFSHASIADQDSLTAIKSLGSRLAHLHLTDGNANNKDAHLVPGDGQQPVRETLQYLKDSEWNGVVAVEVSTRKFKEPGEREELLRRSLEFARESFPASV